MNLELSTILLSVSPTGTANRCKVFYIVGTYVDVFLLE
uniref:Uncharacterized protein n=1 Tax=Myoviridae sp. cteo515 TaxID=2823550 RepID=A0A8S5LBE0_9CAUD|nr:MAG TPA: hypothetical protein [Myoviridae sp. cteo515]